MSILISMDDLGNLLLQRKSLISKQYQRWLLKKAATIFGLTLRFILGEKNMSNTNFQSIIGPGLHRYSIGESKGDWCGAIILDAIAERAGFAKIFQDAFDLWSLGEWLRWRKLIWGSWVGEWVFVGLLLYRRVLQVSFSVLEYV